MNCLLFVPHIDTISTSNHSRASRAGTSKVHMYDIMREVYKDFWYIYNMQCGCTLGNK